MVQKISAQEVNTLITSNEDFIIFDALSHGYFRKQHLPGAINIPLEEVESIAPKIIDKNQKIIVYCFDTECQASPKAASKLEELGYTNVFDMEVGIEGYKSAGFKVVSFS